MNKNTLGNEKLWGTKSFSLILPHLEIYKTEKRKLIYIQKSLTGMNNGVEFKIFLKIYI